MFAPARFVDRNDSGDRRAALRHSDTFFGNRVKQREALAAKFRNAQLSMVSAYIRVYTPIRCGTLIQQIERELPEPIGQKDNTSPSTAPREVMRQADGHRAEYPA